MAPRTQRARCKREEARPRRSPQHALVLLVACAILVATTTTAAGAAGARFSANLPCVSSIDLASEHSPIAGAQRQIDLTFVGFDPNGATDITTMVVQVYRPDGTTLHRGVSGITTTAQTDDRYVTYSGSFPMDHFDAPTDIAGDTAYTLRITLKETDGSSGPTAIAPFDYSALGAAAFSAEMLGFGNLAPGTVSQTVSIQVENLGNVPLDIALAGTELVNTNPELDAHIPADRIHYDTHSSAFEQDTQLSTTSQTVFGFDLMPGQGSNQGVHWYLDTPSADDQYLPAGSYQGQILFNTQPDTALLSPESGGPTTLQGLCSVALSLPDCDAAPGAITHTDLAEDPGFAYEDTDNDGTYTAGIDTQLADAAILDGTHIVVDPDAGLVISSSLGTITRQSGLDYRAGAGTGHLHIQVDLDATQTIRLEAGGKVDLREGFITSTQGAITITSGDHADVRDATLRSKQGLDIDAGGLLGRASTLESTGGHATITTTGPQDAPWADWRATRALQVTAGGETKLTRGMLMSQASDVGVDAGDTLEITCATLDANKAVTVDAEGAVTALLATATSTDTSVTLSGASIDLSHGETHAPQDLAITTTSGDIVADEATIASTSGASSLDAAGTLEAARLELEGRNLARVAAGGDIFLDQVRMVSLQGAVDVISRQGMIDAKEADLNAGGALTIDAATTIMMFETKATSQQDLIIEAGGQLDVDTLELDSTQGKVRVTAGAMAFISLRIEARQAVVVTTTLADATLVGASIESKVDGITLRVATALDATRATFEARQALVLATNGDLRLIDATLESAVQVTATLGTTSATLFVDGAVIDDADDVLQAGPLGITVDGTPASGTVLVA